MAASAIVVALDDLDAVVGTHRRALTTDGAAGMPAHVTLIYPFAEAAALEPEPGGLLVDMIAALEDEFPAFPSFGGIHQTVIPHRTIAQTDDATAMRAAKADVASHLPIRTRVTEVAVMEHVAAGWRRREYPSRPE